MKDFVQLDHALTNRIRTWGHSRYGFWKFIAARSIGIYVLGAFGFALNGQLDFWHFSGLFIGTYIIAIILQKLVKRDRPDFDHLTGYKLWPRTYSSPSAHATLSSGAATALLLLTDFHSQETAIATAIAAIALAIMIGISRIIVGVHYFADIMFGWLLGFVIASGYLIVLN